MLHQECRDGARRSEPRGVGGQKARASVYQQWQNWNFTFTVVADYAGCVCGMKEMFLITRCYIQFRGVDTRPMLMDSGGA